MRSPNCLFGCFLTYEQVFQQLRKPIDPKVLEQREKEIQNRVNASYEKAEQRQHELVSTSQRMSTRNATDFVLARSPSTPRRR